MIILDTEGDVKIQIHPVSMRIERVVDKDFAKIYRRWKREGFPYRVGSGISGKALIDEELLIGIDIENISLFRDFLRGRGFNMV